MCIRDRYTTDDKDGNSIFVMHPDSKTQGPQDKYRMGVPGVTIAATELTEDELVYEDKIKGADGKACWDGYRYAGTEDGKDKCVKVKKAKR